jgi:fucose 4-O-acetylase-like acetyltransferase
LLVVFGHVVKGLDASGRMPAGHWLLVVDYAIYTFHMPIFFLLAGVNAGSTVGKDGFLRSKLKTILYPYLLWSLLQGLSQVAVSGSTNRPLHLSDLPPAILWAPLGQFWFLYALFLCHVFARLTHSARVPVAAFSLAAYVVGKYSALGILSGALNFFLFYAAGLLMAQQLKGLVVRLATAPWLAVTFVGAVVTIYTAMRLGACDAPTALPAAVFGMLFVLQVSALVARAGRLKVVELLGLASMPIYLMHIMAGSGTRIILAKLGVANLWAHLSIGLALGILLPLITQRCLIRAGSAIALRRTGG